MTEHQKLLQRCRCIVDTYPDQIRKLKLEIKELEMGIADAREILERPVEKENTNEKT